MNTLQDEFINIFIIVFFQILTSLIVVRKTNVSLTKGFKRLATSDQSGRDDKLAQNIYTMVESFLNNKFGQDISRESSEGGDNTIESNKKHRNPTGGSGRRSNKFKNRSKNSEEKEESPEKMEITEEKPKRYKGSRRDQNSKSSSRSRRGSQRESPDRNNTDTSFEEEKRRKRRASGQIECEFGDEGYPPTIKEQHSRLFELEKYE